MKSCFLYGHYSHVCLNQSHFDEDKVNRTQINSVNTERYILCLP